MTFPTGCNRNDDKDDNQNNKITDIHNNKYGNNSNITIKRSTFVIMAIVGIAALMISSFFAGYTLHSSITPTYPTIPSPSAPTIPPPMQLPSNIPSQPTTANQIPSQPTTISSVSLDNDPVQGSNDAKITIIEFSDFQCPFCKRAFDVVMPELKEKYVDTGKVKHVYRDYPLPFHQNGIPAAIAAECANEQGKFWDYHDILFTKQMEWENLIGNTTNDKFKEYANNITDVNLNNFQSCVDNQKYKDEVEKDIADGVKYGVSGTPTFYIGNDEKGYTQLVGAQPLASFESVITYYQE